MPRARDRAAKAAYDKARYAARYIDERHRACARDGCEFTVVQPRHGRRLYCSTACRRKVFYDANHVSKPRTYTAPEPLPRSYLGDAIFDEARKVLRFDLPGDLEDDILGEAVLAIVEGRDPKAAVRRFLANEKVQNAHRVDGIDDIGYDEGRLIIVWQTPEEVAA